MDVGASGADRRFSLSYRFFGNLPGEPLSDLDQYPIGQNPRRNAQGDRTPRPKTRRIPVSRFVLIPSASGLVDALFGVRNP